MWATITNNIKKTRLVVSSLIVENGTAIQPLVHLHLRICHVFNMANDGWAAVKGLRAIGVDAELILHRPAHVASLPQWEEADIDLDRVGDLYNPDWNVLSENWTLPSYVHVWDLRGDWYPASRTLKEIRNLLGVGRYDVIIGHIPFAKMAPLYYLFHRKPYIVYDAGWIRYLYLYDYSSYRLGRIGYRKAAKIFFTNVDTYQMFLQKGYSQERLAYTPFAIDMELYAPRNVKNPYDRSPVFLSPSRQDWPEKGNDMLLHAFCRYLKRQPDAILLLVKWGQVRSLDDPENYVHKSRSLIQQLGIEDNVKWLPVMHKRKLIEYYNMADVVFDQFVFGALGTTTPEALSCEKPVVSYVDSDIWTRWHGSAPPVANARSADDIYLRMVELEDSDLRKEYGRKGRKWISETCEMKVVAERQLKVCEEVAGKWIRQGASEGMAHIALQSFRQMFHCFENERQ